MTEDDAYSGEDARQDLKYERRRERQGELRELVEEQEERVEKADKQVEKLEEALHEAKDAAETEERALQQLEDVTIDDFEDVDEIETVRDDDDRTTFDDVEGENPFQKKVKDATIKFKGRL